jgi:ribonuclease HI
MIDDVEHFVKNNKIMRDLYIFIDGSVNTKTKVGYGASLFLNELENMSVYKDDVRIERFENTSSTKLELQNLLLILKDYIELKNYNIVVYTDSQNILSLLDRRQKIENKLFKNHTEYKEFFNLVDNCNLKIIKIKGHKPKIKKDNIDKIFSVVDKAARKALRNKL